MLFLWIYLAAISLVAVIITVSDKRRAIRHRRRIKESTLLLVAAFGGSAAMYGTMLLVHHKTRHLKFMLGIPVIMLAQVAAAVMIGRLMYG